MVLPVVPPFQRRELVAAATALAPALLLGAFADAWLFFGLLEVDAFAATAAEAARFRADVHRLDTLAFVVLVTGCLLAVLMARRPTHGLALYSTLVAVAVVWVATTDRSFAASPLATRIGLGVALWGTAWVILVMHLLEMLRALPRLRWVWATGLIALARGAVVFAMVLLVWLAGPVVGAVGLVVGLVMAALVFAYRLIVSEGTTLFPGLPGTDPRTRTRVPGTVGASHPGPSAQGRMIVLVVLYALGFFALVGVAFGHHFQSRDVPAIGYALLFASAPVGTVLVGYIAEVGGRRPLLYTMPLIVASAIVLYAMTGSSSAVFVGEGFILGGLPFVFQYLVEAVGNMGRIRTWVIAAGAIVAMGAGGSGMAQAQGLAGFDDFRALVLAMAGLVVVLAIAPLLPETRPDPDDEDGLSEYVELARRVQGRR